MWFCGQCCPWTSSMVLLSFVRVENDSCAKEFNVSRSTKSIQKLVRQAESTSKSKKLPHTQHMHRFQALSTDGSCKDVRARRESWDPSLRLLQGNKSCRRPRWKIWMKSQFRYHFQHGRKGSLQDKTGDTVFPSAKIAWGTPLEVLAWDQRASNAKSWSSLLLIEVVKD